jgi:hypothetical protein
LHAAWKELVKKKDGGSVSASRIHPGPLRAQKKKRKRKIGYLQWHSHLFKMISFVGFGTSF